MHRTLTILVVDDEQLARSRLIRLINSLGLDVTIHCVECGDAREAILKARATPPDFAFIDIEMPGESGLSLAQSLRAITGLAAIVFVTAHLEHAFDAYQLGAIDYLQKPVRLERLDECFSRLLKVVENPEKPHETGGTEASLPILVKNGIERLPISQILYFRSEMKYVTVFTAHGEYVSSDALASLEQKYARSFLRIHRNCLVARERISRLYRGLDDDAREQWFIELYDPNANTRVALPISRRQLASVKALLKQE